MTVHRLKGRQIKIYAKPTWAKVTNPWSIEASHAEVGRSTSWFGRVFSSAEHDPMNFDFRRQRKAGRVGTHLPGHKVRRTCTWCCFGRTRPIFKHKRDNRKPSTKTYHIKFAVISPAFPAVSHIFQEITHHLSNEYERTRNALALQTTIQTSNIFQFDYTRTLSWTQGPKNSSWDREYSQYLCFIIRKPHTFATIPCDSA